jgi:hypothetical protein
MLITSGGLVGIQNLNPSAFVNSSGFGNLVVGGGSGETGITIYSGTTGSSGLMFADATTGSGAYTGYIVYRHATDKMEIATGGGTPRLTIESTGAATFTNTITASSFIKSNTLFSCGTGSGKFLGVGSDISGGYLSTDFVLYNTGGDLRLYSTGGVGMIIKDTSGNVGIGSNSVANGTSYGGGGQVNRLKVASGNYTCLEINGNTSGGSIQFTYGVDAPNQVAALIAYNYASGSVNEMNIINGLGGAMTFGTSNIERMRFKSDGFLKAKGNAANYISLNNSSHEISTNQSSNYNTFLVSQTASDPYGLYIWYSGASPNNNMNEFLACADSTNAKAYIFANGNLANRNGTYGTISSDIRLKENIVPATSKLEDLLKLNVVNFNLKDDQDKKKQLGFIAQEFKEVFPSLVYQKDTRKYDEEGNLISGLEDTLGVQVGMEFAILVKAIQELEARVKELENK